MRSVLSLLVVLAAFVVASVVPGTARAAGAVVGTKITGIGVLSTQFAVVTFASTIAFKPICHTGGNGMVIDVTTSKGKALLSLAQSALLADLFVTATGTGTCTNTGSSQENLNALSVTR